MMTESNREPIKPEPEIEEWKRFDFQFYNTWKTWKTDNQGFPILMIGSFFEPSFFQITLGFLGFCVTLAIYKKEK